MNIPAPRTTNELDQPILDSLARFRIRPEQFEHIDFKNYSYGPYRSWTKVYLNLKDGELELPNNSGWFELKDVYYKDMTGDGKEEAIVWLSHASCRSSCDDGTNLFYIYTERNGKLKPIWEYETGSYEYGCGLKSFIVSEKQIVLESFGDCPLGTVSDPGSTRFKTQGFTSIRLEFNGLSFAQKSINFFVIPPKNLQNYEPGIYVYSLPIPQSGSSLLPQ